MKDRVSKYPGRVLITPEDGSPAFYATMTRADEPTQAGDPLNKSTLLSDNVAALMELGAEATPNDMFAALSTTRRIDRLVIERIEKSCAWTVPKAVGQKFKVYAAGGGGGGGGAYKGEQFNSPGGGGGGGYVQTAELILSEGTVVDVVCGAGGSPGMSSDTQSKCTDGGNGGTTAFGLYLSASGGKGGYSPADYTYVGRGGDGGSGGGGIVGGNGGTYGGGGGGTSQGGNGGTYGGGGGGLTVGQGGTYGGDGGQDGTNAAVPFLDALLSLNAIHGSRARGYSVEHGGGGYGSHGGKGFYLPESTLHEIGGGGGGGYLGVGGNSGGYSTGDAFPGGGGGGYGGRGGNATAPHGGGGGGGLFADGADGTSNGGGGGGGLQPGDGMTGGDGGVIVVYYQAQNEGEVLA